MGSHKKKWCKFLCSPLAGNSGVAVDFCSDVKWVNKTHYCYFPIGISVPTGINVSLLRILMYQGSILDRKVVAEL